MADNENLIHAHFFIHTVKNDVKSEKEGRPIYDEYEAVEIRMAANKRTVAVFPAHEVWKNVKNFATGEVTPTTYAMRFPEQYKAFKNGLIQTQSGTPLEELPFLSQSKRLELKALNIYTAEALAMLDGQPLKMLGMGGRELKNQAQAYLDKAKGSVDVVKMAATIAELQAKIEQLTAGGSTPAEAEAPASAPSGPSPFIQMEPDDIKNWIESETGERPKGNPNHATLVKKADEINAELARKAQQVAA